MTKRERQNAENILRTEGGGWVFIEMTSARDDVAKISKYSRSAKDNLLDWQLIREITQYLSIKEKDNDDWQFTFI